jgi:cell filamentation protein
MYFTHNCGRNSLGGWQRLPASSNPPVINWYGVNGKYQATVPQVEFEPGSRGRVLCNLLGIRRVRDMHAAESHALELAQVDAVDHYGPNHRFTTDDIRALHRLWLGPIYSWAGEYRGVNIRKGGFQFAHAPLVPSLMAELERGALCQHTPCHGANDADAARALAEVHAVNSSWCTRFGTAMVAWRVSSRC